ncbi:MAG: hypothetical protein KC618_01110 [Candidatus Omnitrophica bacterium]|nr:hypothetical protein [Candidatus Omnitrophota bacterium]
MQKITQKSFRRYGRLIHYPAKNTKGTVRNLWRIVYTEKAKVGWRVAYLVLRDKSIGRMECHPYSDETFEPVKGKALLFVSKTRDFNDVECFLLDQPVILFKGIWHGLITLGAETEIKITENSKVTCRYWPFGFRVRSLKDLNKKREGNC